MRFTITSKLFMLLMVLALALTGAVWAQNFTQGAISGTVTDASGAVLPNAMVKIKNLDKGYAHELTSGAAGGFQFNEADPGNYLVEVTASGFKTYSARITVVVSQVTTVNAKLEVGAAGTTVEVSGAAPLLETEAADMSTAFDQNLVANLPNGGNDLTAVAYTAPGVIMNNAGGYGNFNANGLPATSNVFTVDGENQMDPFLNLNNSGPTNLMLGKNSIDEASVVTNAYSGQYGQQAGAQVNYVSKGGTNSYHGNLQYEWTGAYLDANNWFNGFYSNPAQATPFANNNEWAASIGGPIKKDKAFFFLDTEGIRYIVPSTVSVIAPTPAFLTDVLNNLPVAASSSGGAYPNASAATIATYTAAAKIWESAPNYTSGVVQGPSTNSCLDPITGTVPDPNTATTSVGCTQVYNTSAGLPATEWLLIGRLDYNFTQKDRAHFRFDIDIGTQATYADPIDPSAFSAASYQPEYNNQLVWNHVFNGTTTNQFVAAASYYRAVFDELTNGSTSPFPYSLFLAGGTSIYPLNYENFVFPQGRNVTQYQFIDDFAKTIGRHNFKAGANFRRYDITNYDASIETTPQVVAGLTDFFNGGSTEYFQNNPLKDSAPMNTGGIGLYAQDEWAIKSNLKLTFALRAEHNFNPTCDIDCFTLPVGSFAQVSSQGIGTPYNQAITFGRGTAFNSVDTIDWSPRVGFTWSPLASQKTVLSGGIGLFYDAFPAFITDSFVNIPYLVPVSLYGADFGLPPVQWADPKGAAATVLTTANTIRNGNASLGIPSLANGLTATELVAAGGAVPNITGFPGKLRTPQYQEWNFQVQQQLDSKSRLTLAYVGNHGIFEPYPNSTLNAYDTAGTIFGYPTASPDQRFGSYTDWISGAISNHNALVAGYTRRATAGLVFNVNYQYSHTLDEISNGGLLNYGVTAIQGQINPAGLRLNNYGNADYDIRHAFNANYVWTEPFHMNNKFENSILGGWLVSENFIVRSGVPFTVTDGTTAISSGSTATPVQPIGNGQGSCVNGFSACFSSADFLSANSLGNPTAGGPATYFPTETRNQYRGPGFFDSDVTVGKTFRVKERVNMAIGLNLYNAFNHPSFENPNHSWTSSTCSNIPTGYQGAQASCGFISGVAAPPTGAYGSFFQGLPAGREGQLTFKMDF